MHIAEAFEHSWRGYRRFAWGRDEVRPISLCGSDGWGGVAVTLIDALDTAMLMGMDGYAKEAVGWLGSNWSFGRDHYMNTFEMTIRVLGGLVAAYDLSLDPKLLGLATQVADAMMPAFRAHGLPEPQVNPRTGHARTGFSTIASQGSVQLEYARLAHITRGARFASVADSWALLSDAARRPSSLNGGHDSLHEYVLKLYLLDPVGNRQMRHMYNTMVSHIESTLLKRGRTGRYFLASTRDGGLMEHLACFAPGMFALGLIRNCSDHRARDLLMASRLTETCYSLYAENLVTGLAPDVVVFSQDGRMEVRSPKFILRPETIESLFYMWRLTKNETYREWGWNIFQSIRRCCRVEGGYTGLRTVSDAQSLLDEQPSFWLAETLKYLYLLFSSDDLLPLDEFVLNTEAHPLRAKRDAPPHT